MQNDPAAPSLLAHLAPEIAAALPEGAGEFGLPDGAKPAAIAGLLARHEGAALIVAPTPGDADELMQSLPAWLAAGQLERLMAFPPRDTVPYDQTPPDPATIEARQRALDALRAECAPGIVVSSADAVAQRTLAVP